MVQESRTRKTFLNARVNLIFYFLTLLLSFFSRKIFLDILGADFIGLTGTLQNLLSFLNVVELGIGGTIGYVLYKPLFDNNQNKIKEIISVLGYMYKSIGKIILFSGIILSFFLPLIFPNTKFELSIIFFAYYAFLTSSLIGYFINYRQTLLSADQKNYVVTAYFQTGNILKTIIQMISAYYTQNYYLWVIIELFFGVIYSFILNWRINIVYPWLKIDNINGKNILKKYPEIIKLTKQAFAHKLGGIVQFQLTPFLIYAFVSLQTVAFYGNYSLISEKICTLLKHFLNSTDAGVGNLIAEGKINKIISVYWELMTLRFLCINVLICTLYKIIPIFIYLWLGDDYILSNHVLIFVLVLAALNILRGTTDQFIFGFGLFFDIWSPIIETLIYFSASIVGGYLWGLEGVLLGNVISLIIVIYCWKPYLLFKYGFKISTYKYWIVFLKLLLLSTISFVLFTYICDYLYFEVFSWLSFIKYSISIFFILLLINILVFYIGSSSTRLLLKRFSGFCFSLK